MFKIPSIGPQAKCEFFRKVNKSRDFPAGISEERATHSVVVTVAEEPALLKAGLTAHLPKAVFSR